MTKAKLELPNGTVVTIEGTTEEVQNLIEFYSRFHGDTDVVTRIPEEASDTPDTDSGGPNLAEIVNVIKSCDEAEKIETQILDRTSEVNRVLLPLYVIHEYLDNQVGLTTVEISNITTDLGVRVYRQNVLRSLTGSSSGYVIADMVRRHGVAARYKLNRRGVQYIKSVIQGGTNDDKK